MELQGEVTSRTVLTEIRKICTGNLQILKNIESLKEDVHLLRRQVAKIETKHETINCPTANNLPILPLQFIEDVEKLVSVEEL